MIKLIAFLKRKPDMTMEEFKERWIGQHSRIASHLPGLKGYRINIALPTQPENAPDYDGTAELWWDSLEAMEASFASPLGRQSSADSDLFSTMHIHLYTEEYVALPGPLPDIRTS